jgi:hypothetical protein
MTTKCTEFRLEGFRLACGTLDRAFQRLLGDMLEEVDITSAA